MRILGYSLIGLFSLISALYGFPELDEGICIQWAKAYSLGANLYSEVPLVYGPLYAYLIELLFSSFGFLHVTSRLMTYSLAVFSSYIMYLASKRLEGESLNLIVVMPVIWLLSSCPRLSESLHPGWFIALLLTFYAFCYSYFDGKKRSVCLGVTLGLILGLKPHLAIMSFLVVLSQLEFSRRRIAPFVTLVLLTIVASVLLKGEILSLNIPYLMPYFVTLLLCCYGAKIRRRGLSLQENKELKSFILSFVLSGAIIYLPQLMKVGISNIKHQMLDLPSLRYHTMYLDNISGSSLELSTILVIGIFIYIAFKYEAKLFLGFVSLICFALVLLPNLFATYAFVLLHFMIFSYFVSKGREDKLSLVLLSLVQVFHHHPVLGSQLYYSTPILVILFVEAIILFIADLDAVEILPTIRKLYKASICAIIASMIFLTLWVNPALSSLLRGEIKIYSGANDREFILVSTKDKDKDKMDLVNYIRSNLTSSDTLFIIPPYYSLNYLSGISLPSPVAVPYYSYLDGNLRKETFNDLMDSEYLIILPKSNRFKLETEHQPYGNELYKAVLEKYDLVEVEDLRRIDWVRIYKKRV